MLGIPWLTLPAFFSLLLQTKSGAGTRRFFGKKTDHFMFITWVCGKKVREMERVWGGWFPGEALGR